MIGRALRRACPRCGAPVFNSYFKMKEYCLRCGVAFEREPGYWVGAVIINTAVVFATFIVVLVGATLLTWPDVPWPWVFAVTIGANLLIPILFYPLSKTVWAALEMSWHPHEPQELADAARRVSGET